ncbi:hypothetical protein JCM8097_005223 [Rhodosporidiobolus ruineniae]
MRHPRHGPLAPVVVVLVALLPLVNAAFYSSQRKQELREMAAEAWRHAYNSYKRVAFPADELLPLTCGKQGHDRRNPDNGAVNDVMGDYALTLVDSLDTFAMLNDRAGFEQAVRDTIAHVSFDVDSRVQVFEVTIRMMGGLLSGHLLAQPTPPPSSVQDPAAFASSIRGFDLPWYRGELLHLAHDLGRRLLPAFNTPTGIPFARIHLQRGLRGKDGKSESGETCSAGAGSLLLEFITLSRLTSDPIYEQLARKAFFAVWNLRSEIGLLGNTIDARTGGWMHGVSNTGAGIDSFFEYAAKAYILTGEEDYHRVWNESYAALQRYSRSPDGFWYRGVNMHTGQLASVSIDSLSAFFPGVQALMGDLAGAVKTHAPFAHLWSRFGGLPEVSDTHGRRANHLGYPLRPEFIESNMYLYQATGDDYYLTVAEQILHDLNNRTRVDCGFAAVLNLATGELENKMPSFMTAETLKYLYLTFDEGTQSNPFLRDDSAFVFTTEGHPLEIPHPPKFRPLPSHPNRNRKKRVFTPPPPASSASPAPLQPTCPAHEPEKDPRYRHFLALGMDRRTDWEHARWLAGLEVAPEEEEREVSEGRWSAGGWCDLPQGEDPVTVSNRASTAGFLLQSYDVGIELLFASSASGEITSPSPSQLSFSLSTPGDLVVHRIAGLRFSLARTSAAALAAPGPDAGYTITAVGGHKVPPGASVVIRDRAVLAGLPPRRVERLALWAEVAPRGQAPMSERERREREEDERERERERSRTGTGTFAGLLQKVLGGGGAGELPVELDEDAQGESCGCDADSSSYASDFDPDLDAPMFLHLPALAASFGPSLAAAPTISGPGSVTPFVLDGEPLPLVLPPFGLDGCEPHHPPSSSSPSSPSSSATDYGAPATTVEPHLLLLHRGRCSFALKAHYAALSGASGVVLISSPSSLPPSPSSSAPAEALSAKEAEEADGFVVPSADPVEEGEETMKALVPLVLVGNSTGTGLEEMVRHVRRESEERAVRIPTGGDGEEDGGEEEREGPMEVFVSVHHEHEEEEEHVAGLLLGGYVVRNVKLARGR